MNEISQKVRGVFADWFGDGPWRSKSVLAALAAVVVGLGLWVSDIKNGPPQNETDQAASTTPGTGRPGSIADWNWSKPFPIYVRLAGSYVVAYCLGWLFRRLMRLLLLISVAGIALLAYGKFAGWNLTHTQQQLKQGGEQLRQAATAEKNHIKSLLPSATAAGVGMFMGFWRRNRDGAPSLRPPQNEAQG